MRIVTRTLGSLSLALSVAITAPAWGQERVGVVTTVIGPVTVTRTSLPGAPLKFKDDILLRDRVTTGDNAMTRILMGGKVVVTARERSTLTITEVPGLSTIDLTSGRIAVAVDKARMKPGERVDVRTPNAIAGVRGTVLIVEAQRNTSSVTVLSGLVDVVRLDPATGRAVGPVTAVGSQQAVTVRNNVLPPRAQTITPNRAQQLSEQFTPPMRTVNAVSLMPVADEVARANVLVEGLVADERRGTALPGGVQFGTDRVGSASPSSPVTTSPLSTPTATVLSTTSIVPTTTTTLLSTTSIVPTTTTTTTNLVSSTTNLLSTTTSTLLSTTSTTLSTTSSLLQGTTKLLK
jgi:hypothetical protein